jgi:hypothetical protein
LEANFSSFLKHGAADRPDVHGWDEKIYERDRRSGDEEAWEDVRSTHFEIRYSVEEEAIDSWSTGDLEGIYKELNSNHTELDQSDPFH